MTPSGGSAWWRDAVVYQIYPRSFADSDGDGIGDLPGITGRLSHLADLGVDAIWLSPFYPSPQADAGYDISDHRDVDPAFGTLHDVDVLLERAHDARLKVIIDLVPNHTSEAHPWFREALSAGAGSPARARYVFRDGVGPGGRTPPNNWRSVFGGPAWTRVTEPDGRPGQWYLHLYDASQPDLDWSNPEIHDEFESIITFWLDRGVDGFRVDVAHGLVKDPALPDWEGPVRAIDIRDGARPPMWDQDGVHEIYRRWRQLLDRYPGERILVGEAWVGPAERRARYVRPDEMHQVFDFEFLRAGWNVAEVRSVIRRSLHANGAVGAPSSWVLSNHDVVRHPTRLSYGDAWPASWAPQRGIGRADAQPDEGRGLRRGRAATLVMLALPGSAYLYQGEELGLPDHTTLPDEARRDPMFRRSGGASPGRDGCRVPLPWSAEGPSLGFGPAEGWLPQPAEWARYAAARQQASPGSTLSLYRQALRLRRDRRLGSGELRWHDGLGTPLPDDVLAFTNRDVLVVANLSRAPVRLPGTTSVLLASAGAGEENLLRAGLLPPDCAIWLAG